MPFCKFPPTKINMKRDDFKKLWTPIIVVKRCDLLLIFNFKKVHNRCTIPNNKGLLVSLTYMYV